MSEIVLGIINNGENGETLERGEQRIESGEVTDQWSAIFLLSLDILKHLIQEPED